jgi:hypothetical protein
VLVELCIATALGPIVIERTSQAFENVSFARNIWTQAVAVAANEGQFWPVLADEVTAGV